LFCNLSTVEPRDLAWRVADLYLDQAGVEAPSAPVSDEGPNLVSIAEADLRELAGFYFDPISGLVTEVQSRNGQLILEGNRRLTHVGDRRFQGQGRADTVVFTARPGGSVTMTGPSGEESIRRAAQSPSLEALGAYAGRYRSDELEADYEVQLGNGYLRLTHSRTGARTLHPTFRDGFRGGGVHVTFARNPDGLLNGFTLSSSRAWKIWFHRVDRASEEPDVPGQDGPGRCGMARN
jgi:hypothetical protein